MEINSKLKPISLKKQAKIEAFIVRYTECDTINIMAWRGNRVIIEGYEGAHFVIYKALRRKHWTFEHSSGFINRPTLKDLLIEASIHIGQDRYERVYNKSYYFNSDETFKKDIEWALER